MKYFITLFFTILVFTLTQGQTVVDVNADYFWLDIGKNISLVRKENNSIIVIEVNYDADERTILLDTTIYDEISFSEFKEDYVREKETFLPINKLYKNKTDKFILQLSNYQFNNVFEDGFIRHKINITKDNNLLVRDYSSDASLNEFVTIPFAILRINKKYSILVIDDNDRDVHFIMQKSKNYFARIETDQEKLQIIKKELSDSIINELINFRSKRRWEEDEKITVQQIIKEKDKYGIKNLLGDQILPCIYDTIILPNENELFLALKDGKGVLYNRYFKQIANNIRCVIPFRNLFYPYIVLQNNKLRYISDNFVISDTLKKCVSVVCGTVTTYNFETEKTEYGFKIYKEIGGLTEIIPQVFPYSLDEKYDNLLFFNGQNKFSFDDNDELKFQKPNILVFEKNKQFGIIEIEMPLLDCRQDSLSKYKRDIYDYGKKIVFEHQTITPKIIVSKLDSVIFSSKYDYPAKIYKNGLCTYFPISKDPKYAEIQDFNGYFSRFRFPNGKEGWLSRDGIEYIDE